MVGVPFKSAKKGSTTWRFVQMKHSLPVVLVHRKVGPRTPLLHGLTLIWADLSLNRCRCLSHLREDTLEYADSSIRNWKMWSFEDN